MKTFHGIEAKKMLKQIKEMDITKILDDKLNSSSPEEQKKVQEIRSKIFPLLKEKKFDKALEVLNFIDK